MDNCNIPLGSIQRILGHENRTTTETYLHSINQSEFEAMAVDEPARGKSYLDWANSHLNPHLFNETGPGPTTFANCNLLKLLVPGAGLEPARCEHRGILRHMG